jgi:predicted nucleic acid-binding protein
MPAIPVVVDASVVLKWLFPEEHRQIALRLLDSYQRGEIELRAPELLVSEVGNVIARRVWRGLLDKADARGIFDLFLAMAPQLYPGALFARDTLGISIEHRRTFYDSLYLACAARWNCELITADEKFFNAMSGQFRRVRLLTTV